MQWSKSFYFCWIGFSRSEFWSGWQEGKKILFNAVREKVSISGGLVSSRSERPWQLCLMHHSAATRGSISKLFLFLEFVFCFIVCLLIESSAPLSCNNTSEFFGFVFLIRWLFILAALLDTPPSQTFQNMVFFCTFTVFSLFPSIEILLT